MKSIKSPAVLKRIDVNIRDLERTRFLAYFSSILSLLTLLAVAVQAAVIYFHSNDSIRQTILANQLSFCSRLSYGLSKSNSAAIHFLDSRILLRNAGKPENGESAERNEDARATMGLAQLEIESKSIFGRND